MATTTAASRPSSLIQAHRWSPFYARLLSIRVFSYPAPRIGWLLGRFMLRGNMEIVGVSIGYSWETRGGMAGQRLCAMAESSLVAWARGRHGGSWY